MIKLDNLYYLREASKSGSISKAAERLYMSKSALSAAIRNLEKELGVELLNRSVSGVELSAIGEDVMRKADLIFDIVAQIEKDCYEYQTTDTVQTITYIMPSGMAANLFSDLLRHFRVFLNDAKINIKSTNSEERIIAEVKANENAVGFWFSPALIDDAAIHIEKIGECEIGIVAKKHSRYITEDKMELTAEDLINIPIIQYTMEDVGPISEWDTDPFTGKGDQMNIILNVDNQTIFYEALYNDLGVGMTTKISMNNNAERRNSLRFISVAGSREIGLYMLTNLNFPTQLCHKHKQVMQRMLEINQD